MTKRLDKAATINMLAALRDGDNPLGQGDVFVHPMHGAMTVSRVLGWRGSFRLEDQDLKSERVFVVTAFRQGRKKAERVSFLLPKREAN